MPGEVAKQGVPHVAPARRLDVSLVAGYLHAALYESAALLELAEVQEGPALEDQGVGVRAADVEAGSHGEVSVRELQGTVQDRHHLAVLADVEEGVRAARGDHVERRVLGFLRQGGRLTSEDRHLLDVAVVD